MIFPTYTCFQRVSQLLLTCMTFGLYDCSDALEMRQQIIDKALGDGQAQDAIDYVAIKSQK